MKNLFRLKKLIALTAALAMLLSGIPAATFASETVYLAESNIENVTDDVQTDVVGESDEYTTDAVSDSSEWTAGDDASGGDYAADPSGDEGNLPSGDEGGDTYDEGGDTYDEGGDSYEGGDAYEGGDTGEGGDSGEGGDTYDDGSGSTDTTSDPGQTDDGSSEGDTSSENPPVIDDQTEEQSTTADPEYPTEDDTVTSVPDDTIVFSTVESLPEELVGANDIPLTAGVLVGDSLSSVLANLKSVRNYGIVASKLDNSSNQRTNMAVGSYTGDTAHTATPDLAGDYEIPFIVRNATDDGAVLRIGTELPAHASVYLWDTAAQDRRIAPDSSTRNNLLKVYKTIVRTSDQKSVDSQNDPLTVMVSQLIRSGNNASKTIYGAASGMQVTAKVSDDKTTCEIDTTGPEFGDSSFIVINADPLCAGGDADYLAGGSLTIRKKSGQTIAFTTTGSNVTVGRFTVISDDVSISSVASDKESQNGPLRNEVTDKIIWNLRGASSVTLRSMAGTVLVPSSANQVYLAESSSGTIVANGTINAGASWHFLNRNRTSYATLAAKKTAVSEEKTIPAIPAKAFSFEIVPVTSDAPMPGGSATLNGYDGYATFDRIEISDPQGLAGSSYIYKITETGVSADQASEWQISTAPVYAKVTVRDNGSTLIRYYTDEACTQNESTFGPIENTYIAPPKPPTPIRVGIKVTKVLQVRRNCVIKDENHNTSDFIFDLEPQTSGRESDKDQVTIENPGARYEKADVTDSRGIVQYQGYKNEATFKPLRFTEPGSYVYRITEEDLGATGYIYSPSVYTLTINIGVDEKNNKLTASVVRERTSGGKTTKAGSITFTNRYSPEPITESIRVTKNVQGSPSRSETFTFVLGQLAWETDASGNRTAVFPELDRVTITGSGSANFKERTYGIPGTYTYQIKEIAGNGNYLYDRSLQYVTITVTDKGGVLQRDMTDTRTGAEFTGAAFTNTYVSGSVSFYKVRADKQNQGVKDAVYEIYGIAADRNSSDYQRYANELYPRGVVDYSHLTRVGTAVSQSNGKVTFENLMANTFYVIREVEAPKGYQISKNPIIIHTAYVNGRFGYTITNNGQGTAGRDASMNIIKWFEHRVKVIINKKRANGELLAGAKLRLIDTTTDQPVEAWTSKSTSGHQIVVKLQTGRTYKVVETAAPRGFKKAADTEFTVTAVAVGREDYVQTVDIIDEATGGRDASGSGGTRRGSGNGSGTGTTDESGVETMSGVSGASGVSGVSGTTSGGNATRTDGSRTGDTSPIIQWLVILILAAAAVIAILVIGRKKRR